MAAATHDTRLAEAADTAFLHAMHVGALWTAGFALIGAVVLAVGFRPDRPTGRGRGHEREQGREQGRAREVERAARAGSSTPS